MKTLEGQYSESWDLKMKAGSIYISRHMTKEPLKNHYMHTAIGPEDLCEVSSSVVSNMPTALNPSTMDLFLGDYGICTFIQCVPMDNKSCT